MSQYLENMVEGLDNVELTTVLKGDARLFTFVAGKGETNENGDLELPENTRTLFYYRDDEFHFIDDKTRFKMGDEIVLLTHSEHLPELKERWQPKQAEEEG